MVVQHNLTAMNSNRMLGLTTASQAKSTEKLSSGYKINRAADQRSDTGFPERTGWYLYCTDCRRCFKRSSGYAAANERAGSQVF